MVKRKLNLKLNWTPIIITALIIVAAFGLFMVYNNSKAGKTISVTGNSELKVMPDKVAINIMIQTRNISADAAKNQNSAISEKVLAALGNLNLSGNSLQTENYNIYQEYDWSDGTQKFIGYVATNYVSVNTDSFDILGKIVDYSVDAGALVNYINFDLSTQKTMEYQTTALAEASKDAKNKAESIATGLGNTLGDIVSVSASQYNYNVIPLYTGAEGGAASDAKAAVTNISPKELTVYGTVTVTYALR